MTSENPYAQDPVTGAAQQPTAPRWAPQAGQPAWGPQPGQPGWGPQPGQPGWAPQPGQPGWVQQPALKRPMWKTVVGIFLIVLGVLALLGSVQSAAAVNAGGSDAAYAAGVVIGRILGVGIFLVPGILLLRAKK